MRRAVITGVGVICAIARNAGQYWDSLSAGVCGIRDITLFDASSHRVKIAAQVPDAYFDQPLERPARRLSRNDRVGLIALEEALRTSGLEHGSLQPERISVVIGSGSGGLLSAEMFKKAALSGKTPPPSWLFPFSSSSFTDLAGRRCNSRGFRMTVSTACSSSSTAIGIAADLIRSNRADMVLTGGSESLGETTFAGFNSLRSVDEHPCRPFDRERKGISLGEGAAMFIVEESARAEARGARIYGEIAGYGISGDAHHVTSPDPEGRGVSCAMHAALRNAGMGIQEIDYINAHGTGTPANDLAETMAIKNAFGARAYDIPVSSTKSMIGHCLGAAGALEAAACILPLDRGIIPPTVHYQEKDPLCDLNYVPQPTALPVRTILSLSLAFGGNNTALVLRKFA